MDTPADVIAALALLLAVTGFVVNRRDIHREQRDRAHEREAQAKDSELLWRYLDDATEADMATGQADVALRPGQAKYHSTFAFHTFDVNLDNGGPGIARHVQAWAVGRDGSRVSGTEWLGSLAASVSAPMFTLTVPFAVLKRPISLRVAWTDSAGRQEKTLEELLA